MGGFFFIQITKLLIPCALSKYMLVFVLLSRHMLELTLSEILQSVLKIHNEVDNSNRGCGGPVESFRDSATICLKNNILDSDIPCKRDSFLHCLDFSPRLAEGVYSWLLSPIPRGLGLQYRCPLSYKKQQHQC